ncbi:MAG: type II toxin-antitoxin system VapC family toxin [bacterium]|nr:type II toxin-antitoxin system VapC family toxin [bacterium]
MIETPPDFYQVTEHARLLLDTNFFIDALNHAEEFQDFETRLKARGVTFVTIEPVLIEFLKGASNTQEIKKRKDIIENLIDAYLPVNKEIFRHIQVLISRYGQEGKEVSLTDFLLGGALMKYTKGTFLVTRDIRDFPTNIFTRATYFYVAQRRSIQFYGLYQYPRGLSNPQ